jgi:hypothetical protein
MDLVSSWERPFFVIFGLDEQIKESAKHEFERQGWSGWNMEEFNIITNIIAYIDHHLQFQLKSLKEDQNEFATRCGKFFSRLKDTVQFNTGYDVAFVSRIIKIKDKLKEEDKVVHKIRTQVVQEVGDRPQQLDS